MRNFADLILGAWYLIIINAVFSILTIMSIVFKPEQENYYLPHVFLLGMHLFGLMMYKFDSEVPSTGNFSA